MRGDDIPEALRAEPNASVPPARSRPLRLPFLWGAVVLSAAALGFVVWQQMQLPIAQSSIGRSASSAVAGLDQSADRLAVTPSPLPPPLLGHFPYAQAPAASLAAIVSDGSIKLRQPAATRFVEMVKAANAQGIALRPISGFRSLSEQEHIFFDVKAERGQQVHQRAAVSAPPGYSEHHTGYAIDIGDGANPATDLQQSFQNTAAFRWLQQNAPRYGFEMSFPRNNPQGVSYEPWHWRFVGDRTSLETFYRARSQPRSQP
nr:M15 family metallopeptidase [Microcoleus sp. FACHB-1515]